MVLTSIVGFGQTPGSRVQAEERERLRQQQDHDFEKRDFERRMRNLQKLVSTTDGTNSNSKRPSFIRELFEEKSLAPEERAKITPAQEDYSKFADFLSKKDTGLVKILLEPKCGNSMVVDINDPKCSDVFPLKGNGAYYSFRLGSHAKSAASDIYYADGKFEVGFEKELLGILVDLGDKQIELLEKKDSTVDALKDFKVPKDYAGLSALKLELKKGIVQNGVKYYDNLTVKMNTTYLIRTVAYQYAEQAFNDKRIDTVLAFRVVKIENDSITILWKRLNWKWSGFVR